MHNPANDDIVARAIGGYGGVQSEEARRKASTTPVRRCKGTLTLHNGKKRKCGRAAVTGSDMCHAHGGKTTIQTVTSARMKAASFAPDAITVLAEIMNNDRANDSDRIKAANSILDRAGLGRTSHIETTTTNMNEMLRLALAEQQKEEPLALEVIEVEEE